MPDSDPKRRQQAGPGRRARRQRTDAFQRARHARYYEHDIVYHILFRTTEGLYLLKPDADGQLRRLVAGILGQARQTFKGIRNHATVLLSNHGHLALSGDAAQLAAYVGFIKRELSRRWGPVVRWRRLFEESYHATAVITPQAQRACLKYILAQSVKEGICAHPGDWPGFHCADALVTGEPVQGAWFDGTSYGTAIHREKRRKVPRQVRRADYLRPSHATFDPLPCMRDLRADEYRRQMASIVDEVVAEGRAMRGDRPPMGPEAVISKSTRDCSEIPPPPWFENRRRMVVWDNPQAAPVQSYLRRYWVFQGAFRQAADRWLDGELQPGFPPGSFRPGLPQPLPQVQSMGP